MQENIDLFTCFNLGRMNIHDLQVFSTWQFLVHMAKNWISVLILPKRNRNVLFSNSKAVMQVLPHMQTAKKKIPNKMVLLPPAA